MAQHLLPAPFLNLACVQRLVVESIGCIDMWGYLWQIHTRDSSEHARLEETGRLGLEGSWWARLRLRGALSDPAPQVRLGALEALRLSGDRAAAHLMARALTDAEPRVRIEVAAMLGETPGEYATRALKLALRDIDASVRKAAAVSMGSRHDPIVVPWLTQALRDEDEEVRCGALEGLAAVGNAKAIQGLFQGLGDSSSAVRQTALGYLAMLGGDAVTQMAIAHFQHSSARVRRYAAAVMRRIPDARAMHPLTVLMSDPEPKVRREAVAALGALGDRRALPVIESALRDPDEQVRAAAREAQQFLRSGGGASEPRGDAAAARQSPNKLSQSAQASPVSRASHRQPALRTADDSEADLDLKNPAKKALVRRLSISDDAMPMAVQPVNAQQPAPAPARPAQPPAHPVPRAKPATEVTSETPVFSSGTAQRIMERLQAISRQASSVENPVVTQVDGGSDPHRRLPIILPPPGETVTEMKIPTRHRVAPPEVPTREGIAAPAIPRDLSTGKEQKSLADFQLGPDEKTMINVRLAATDDPRAPAETPWSNPPGASPPVHQVTAGAPPLIDPPSPVIIRTPRPQPAEVSDSAIDWKSLLSRVAGEEETEAQFMNGEVLSRLDVCSFPHLLDLFAADRPFSWIEEAIGGVLQRDARSIASSDLRRLCSLANEQCRQESTASREVNSVLQQWAVMAQDELRRRAGSAPS